MLQSIDENDEVILIDHNGSFVTIKSALTVDVSFDHKKSFETQKSILLCDTEVNSFSEQWLESVNCTRKFEPFNYNDDDLLDKLKELQEHGLSLFKKHVNNQVYPDEIITLKEKWKKLLLDFDSCLDGIEKNPIFDMIDVIDSIRPIFFAYLELANEVLQKSKEHQADIDEFKYMKEYIIQFPTQISENKFESKKAIAKNEFKPIFHDKA